MKFIHIADIHFDVPFTTLGLKGLSEQRRLEQRDAFKRTIEFIKENGIEILLIAGDLYENEYIRMSTINYINNLFKEIPNTKIFISPGNHDPFLKNSFYEKFEWNKNVYIFNEMQRVEYKNIDIYGYGFRTFESEKVILPKELRKDRTNILLMHGDMDGNSNYNSISKKELLESGFDYIALGHIHKKMIQKNIVYPGSMISCGFDELNEHGIILGEFKNGEKKANIEFIKMDKNEFVEKEFDVSQLYSEEELVEKINSLELIKENYYKIILTGNKNFEINTTNILKNIYSTNIVKVKDCTKIGIDIKELSKEESLKGIFVRSLLNDAEEQKIDIEDAIKAIEIGLEAM